VRLTLIGHASVLVEMEAATCLMDPVFFDPFEDGTVVSCPSRTVHLEALPRIDLLVVSHRHPDHFDLPSLNELPRDCDAICPADPLIVYGLRELGFERIHPVHPMGEIVGDGFELYPTRSEIRSIPEFGMVFHDRSGTVWNQVDSFLSQETIDVVSKRFGRLDVLLAMYASQNFDFFEDRSTEFPFDTHRQNLDNVMHIQPQLAVPASAGFRFVDELAWLNRLVFPISRERFVRDLHQLEPRTSTCVMNPGDVIHIDGDDPRCLRAASDVAFTHCDDTERIDFDPTAPIPELVDPNPHGTDVDELVHRVEELVIEPLREFVTSPQATTDPVVSSYRDLCVRYTLGIVGPDGPAGSYEWDFGSPPPQSQLTHRIAASALLEWAAHAKDFFSVRCWSRRTQLCYRVRRDDRQALVARESVPDLLMHYLINVAPGSELAAKHHVDRHLRELADAHNRH
jgi:UDP-MurNAc hydroxylase